MVNNRYMMHALDLAKRAFLEEEVPVGAVIVHDGKIIAEGYNQTIKEKNALLHAEVIVLQKAMEYLSFPILSDCDLYVTLEPCCMCAGAISASRIRRLYFGAYDIKGGFIDHNGKVFNHTLHKPESYGGILEQSCSHIIQDFFKKIR